MIIIQKYHGQQKWTIIQLVVLFCCYYNSKIILWQFYDNSIIILKANNIFIEKMIVWVNVVEKKFLFPLDKGSNHDFNLMVKHLSEKCLKN